MSKRQIIILSALVIVAILIITQWDKIKSLFTKRLTITTNAPEPQRTVEQPERIVIIQRENILKRAIDEVYQETANARVGTEYKYNLLNQKLSSYGAWVGNDGVAPPQGNMIKCCCRSSIFMGSTPLDCYWSTNCNSSSSQSACS